MNRFSSAFAPKLEAMLEYRAARGYKEKSYLHSLNKFDKFCFINFPNIDGLTNEIVHAWLDSEVSEESSLAAPATVIRQLGKYLAAVGENAYILPERFTPKKSKFTPHIFTDKELSLVFSEIDKLKPNKKEPFLSEISPVLFRLIYTCGLRPNEGRELKRENVNFDTGELLITNTKHAKERIVVMSDDMLKMCRAYDIARNVFGGNSIYFFPANDGGTFTSTQIANIFTKAWTRAVCSAENPVPRSIRVYDLRHRFASACLNRWLDEGRDLMVMLPYLRAYMGHNTLSETAYYIHLLPENLVKTSAIDWAAFNSLLPEVSVCQN
jgi:integrase